MESSKPRDEAHSSKNAVDVARTNFYDTDPDHLFLEKRSRLHHGQRHDSSNHESYLDVLNCETYKIRDMDVANDLYR